MQDHKQLTRIPIYGLRELELAFRDRHELLEHEARAATIVGRILHVIRRKSAR